MSKVSESVEAGVEVALAIESSLNYYYSRELDRLRG